MNVCCTSRRVAHYGQFHVKFLQLMKHNTVKAQPPFSSDVNFRRDYCGGGAEARVGRPRAAEAAAAVQHPERVGCASDHRTHFGQPRGNGRRRRPGLWHHGQTLLLN